MAAFVTTKEIPKRELRARKSRYFVSAGDASFRLQQKKSQKGNWENPPEGSAFGRREVKLQQKKSQKGNWEPCWRGRREKPSGGVTTKEIPKRELRDELLEIGELFSSFMGRATTKEIPKRELRVHFLDVMEARIVYLSYNKRNPKKGIERRNIWRWHTTDARFVTTKEIPKRELRASSNISHNGTPNTCCYNKRNPKKGIESAENACGPGVGGFWACYNKRNPKKGIESLLPTMHHSIHSICRSSGLQQKKSQKGNWEDDSSLGDDPERPPDSYNKRNPKKGIESSRSRRKWGRGFLLRKLQQNKSQKGNWEPCTRGSRSSSCRTCSVTTKEIPKRELRVAETSWGGFCECQVTTKEIPKRELRVQSYHLRPGRRYRGYNKRNPKKGIESYRYLDYSDRGVGPGYNKRNPKKGIERSPRRPYPCLSSCRPLQQKKSQKGNWE